MTDELEVQKRRVILEKPWVKPELIRYLAEGKKSQVELSEMYGVGQSSIAEFKRRHLPEIQRLRNDMNDKLNDEFTGLWLAEKRARLFDLQHQIEALHDLPVTARTAEVIGILLRKAAEELGQITTSNKVEMDVVRYEIANINLEDLS